MSLLKRFTSSHGERKAGDPARRIEQMKARTPDVITTAIMMIDRDFVVIYVNDATRALFAKHLSEFRKLWPNFDPDRIVGSCIDGFHKHPEHQRRMLADPSRLPVKTEITIGELKIQLLISGAFDAQGQYVGNILEWTDVTEARVNAGMLAAIDKAQAVIEFTLDGKIVDANENFLKVMGYSIDEIRGRHHSMFVEPAYQKSEEYRSFWERLGRGEFDANQYKRIGKGGKVVWIQASYNPILDTNGKPFKVVKYASDITAMRAAVEQMQEVVAAAKSNDLTRRIAMDGKAGEVASLCSGVNDLLDSISAVIAEFKGASAEVSNAASEISASTTDLSQRTEEQAASLEETSASMEQMAATVKKNAENAQAASESAGGAREVADRGGRVVSNAVEAMARIEESSRKISDIIGVIDEIARQTNLLALNAAVEAARAGEAGRGFAVVASEVRSLAQRSSQAAKDIKDLITSSNGQVKEGVELVNRAGAALSEIRQSIESVATVIAEIASASAEQATGIAEVNKALAQMDEATQQNSALVEENAATAKTLEQQANAMNERVGAFHVDGAAAPKRQPVPAVVRPAPKPVKAGAAPPRPMRGPVARMQTAVAAAFDAETEF